MIYLALGSLGFFITHLFDVVSIKRIPLGAKPFTWFAGSGLLAYSLLMICLAPYKLTLPLWSTCLGWVLLLASLSLLTYSLFIELPFRKTYVATGVGDELITTRLYALVRHPGVIWFVPFMLSLVLVAKSSLLLIAAPLFIFLDIVLVVMQDKFFFNKMFRGYDSYRQKTPMLLPNRQSIRDFINSLNQVRPVFNFEGGEKMTKLNELLNQGRYEELWQRCCGFIDLSLGDFMKIQKRLLLEQLALLKSCELGRYILNGTNPTTVEEFQERIPLTTYADYVPYLSERREDVLPEKPLMWAHTSGRSGEYPFKWIPISRRLYEELGAYTFATIIFGSCKQRGEITLRKHDKYLYSLAPAPYFRA